MRQPLAVCALFLSLTACRQGEAPTPQTRPVETAAQKRADDFRQKEQCAIDAQRLDPLFRSQKGGATRSISEVFYSPVRNSCICEVIDMGKDLSVDHILYDCLTREDLGRNTLMLGDPNYEQALDAWNHKKDALKVAGQVAAAPQASR